MSLNEVGYLMKKSIPPLKKENDRAPLKNIDNYFGVEEDFQKFIKQFRLKGICKNFY